MADPITFNRPSSNDTLLSPAMQTALAALAALSYAELALVKARTEQHMSATRNVKPKASSFKSGTWGVIVNLAGKGAMYNGLAAVVQGAQGQRVSVVSPLSWQNGATVAIPAQCLIPLASEPKALDPASS